MYGFMSPPHLKRVVYYISNEMLLVKKVFYTPFKFFSGRRFCSKSRDCLGMSLTPLSSEIYFGGDMKIKLERVIEIKSKGFYTKHWT